MGWHPKLIQASIAVYTGSYAEARRLLDEYRVNEGIAREHGALVQWLSAQAQDEPEERLRRLHVLVNQAENSPYANMASQLLANEAEHEKKMRAAGSASILPGLKTWQVALALAAVVVAVVLIALNPASNIPDVMFTPVPTGVTLTQAPSDTSQALDPQQHTGRYTLGILQLLRFESASQRVIDRNTGEVINPVAGARFYALQMSFECRSGVCDQPPEATLTLQIDTDTRITSRSDLRIAGDAVFAPVALGRVTTGWVVFEIPVISDVQALIISARNNQAFDPITIPLRNPS